MSCVPFSFALITGAVTEGVRGWEALLRAAYCDSSPLHIPITP